MERFNDELAVDFERQSRLMASRPAPFEAQGADAAEDALRLETTVVREQASESVHRLARHLAGVAQAEAHASVGEHAEARAAIVPHLLDG